MQDERTSTGGTTGGGPPEGGPRISVCLAAYNGRDYVREQLASILAQLGPADEVIVVDDASRDDTAVVVKGVDDPRIQLYVNEDNLGYVRTFERALGLARGEYIFLSDQDDLWLPGRAEQMVAALARADVVAGNFRYFGPAEPGRIGLLRLRAVDSRRRALNLTLLWLGLRPYYGCAMALTGGFKAAVLPFPPFLTETHDQWIAMVANLRGRMAHLEQDTLLRRLHADNTTPKRMRSLPQILRARMMIARAFGVALRRRP